ncbi:hypothetical protein G9A89_019648 [Geosiphon pyriformis]|nr:hypothetical protein G9A89_019648 [Geosiphon pyriformis]
MLRKGLKLKTNLPKNFSNEVLYYPELYDLRTFEQVLAENMLAGLVKFANIDGILIAGQSHECFLASATHVLKLCNLLLGSNLLDVFWARNSIAVLDVLGIESYLSIVKSLKRYSVVFLDPRGPVPVWFASLVKFVIEGGLSIGVMLFFCSVLTDYLCDFGYVSKCLLNSGLDSITVYTDGSVKNLGLLCACGDTTAYFPNIDTSVRVKVDRLLSLILVEMQTIILVFECVSVSQLIEKEHIHCVKNHSGVVENKHANFYADTAVTSKFFLLFVVFYCFLVVKSRLVSGNAHYVAKKLFNSVYSVGWEARCVGNIISVDLSICFDKARIFCVWHPDGKIRSGYTSTASATLQLYFMKMLHHCLPVAKRKKIYNLSVACIQCDLVEDFDHVFFCSHDVNVRNTLLSDATLEWNVLLGTSTNGNAIADLLNKTASSIDLFTALAKSFVLKSWMVDIVGHLGANADGICWDDLRFWF